MPVTASSRHRPNAAGPAAVAACMRGPRDGSGVSVGPRARHAQNPFETKNSLPLCCGSPRQTISIARSQGWRRLFRRFRLGHDRVGTLKVLDVRERPERDGALDLGRAAVVNRDRLLIDNDLRGLGAGGGDTAANRSTRGEIGQWVIAVPTRICARGRIHSGALFAVDETICHIGRAEVITLVILKLFGRPHTTLPST